MDQGTCVIAADPLNERQGICAGDDKFSHMADIKHATPRPYCFMFLLQACVLHGHFKPRKRDHFGDRSEVSFEQGRLMQESRFHGTKVGLGSRVPHAATHPRWIFPAQNRGDLQKPVGIAAF